MIGATWVSVGSTWVEWVSMAEGCGVSLMRDKMVVQMGTGLNQLMQDFLRAYGMERKVHCGEMSMRMESYNG